jgi:hypothetical protein
MAHGVGQYSAKDACDNIAHEPGAMSQWLLGAFVPHGNDDCQSWANSRFCDSKEESDRKQPLGIKAGGGQHEDCAPDEAIFGQLSLESSVKVG